MLPGRGTPRPVCLCSPLLNTQVSEHRDPWQFWRRRILAHHHHLPINFRQHFSQTPSDTFPPAPNSDLPTPNFTKRPSGARTAIPSANTTPTAVLNNSNTSDRRCLNTNSSFHRNPKHQFPTVTAHIADATRHPPCLKTAPARTRLPSAVTAAHRHHDENSESVEQLRKNHPQPRRQKRIHGLTSPKVQALRRRSMAPFRLHSSIGRIPKRDAE
jgi:hypothetical protein